MDQNLEEEQKRLAAIDEEVKKLDLDSLNNFWLRFGRRNNPYGGAFRNSYQRRIVSGDAFINETLVEELEKRHRPGPYPYSELRLGQTEKQFYEQIDKAMLEVLTTKEVEDLYLLLGIIDKKHGWGKEDMSKEGRAKLLDLLKKVYKRLRQLGYIHIDLH